MFQRDLLHISQLLRAARMGAAFAATALLLAACGGSGSGTSQSANTYAFGRIAGFGSVVVNGVHYNEGSARILDEDDADHASSDLALGMMVEINADESANAHDIRFLSLMRGPVEGVATDGLLVLGQKVAVNANTVFDDSLNGGRLAIKSGMQLRIFGLLDTGGAYTATRIEAASADSYALLGYVTALNPTAKTLSIGNALIDVSAVSLPTGLAVSSLVRVKLQTTMVNGAWVATAVRSGVRHPPEGDHVEVEGIVTDFTSTSSFAVDGQSVDASHATFPEGTTGLVKGARVEVEGAIVNGVLVATKVEVESESEIEAQGFDVQGVITSIDTDKSTLVVHGVTVSYAGNVTFVGGSASDLKVGAVVEVTGSLASDGTTLNATRIVFGH